MCNERGHVWFSFLPVGRTVDIWVNLRLLLLHHPPGRRGNKKLFVDTVSEAVRDPACVKTRVDVGEKLKGGNAYESQAPPYQ